MNPRKEKDAQPGSERARSYRYKEPNIPWKPVNSRILSSPFRPDYLGDVGAIWKIAEVAGLRGQQ